MSLQEKTKNVPVTMDEKASYQGHLELLLKAEGNFKGLFEKIISCAKLSGIYTSEEMGKIEDVYHIMIKQTTPMSIIDTKKENESSNLLYKALLNESKGRSK